MVARQGLGGKNSGDVLQSAVAVNHCDPATYLHLTGVACSSKNKLTNDTQLLGLLGGSPKKQPIEFGQLQME